jgi:hypothetical protein
VDFIKAHYEEKKLRRRLSDSIRRCATIIFNDYTPLDNQFQYLKDVLKEKYVYCFHVYSKSNEYMDVRALTILVVEIKEHLSLPLRR